jgi:co-chaperonin GroES (HSP10)
MNEHIGFSADTTSRASVAAKIRPTKVLGYVTDPDTLFEAEKKLIWDAVGDLSDIRIPLNRILVALWITKEERRTESGLIIHSPDSTKDEHKWQGRSGLVLKMGPHAYQSDDQVTFLSEDRCDVGDWVLLRPSDGVRINFYQHECVLLESERGIRAVLNRPDLVY